MASSMSGICIRCERTVKYVRRDGYCSACAKRAGRRLNNCPKREPNLRPATAAHLDELAARAQRGLPLNGGE